MNDPHYPDNIRDYDNCPGSPFYEPSWEESDERKEAIGNAIEEHIKKSEADLDAIYEAAGYAESWEKPAQMVRALATAYLNDDKKAFLKEFNQNRADFMQYMTAIVEDSVDAIHQDPRDEQ